MAAGFSVYIHGRNSGGIRHLLKDSRCQFIRLDLRKPGDVRKLAGLAKRHRIDCFISNAGSYSDLGVAIPEKLCRDVMAVNLVAPILVLNAVYAHYRKLNSGTIVAINSLAGQYPNFNEAVYCASKYGLKGFIKSIQMDPRRNSVRILDYYPGAIKTRITRNRPGFDQFIKPEDLADRIFADVTSASSYIPVCQELRKSFPAGR